MGTDLGRRSVRGADERRSARHQPQRRPVDARERIGHYLDALSWDGTRITKNLDFQVVRGAAVREAGVSHEAHSIRESPITQP